MPDTNTDDYRRSVTLTSGQRKALSLIAAARDATVQDLISAAISALIMTEMQQDRVLTLAIAKGLGVTWESLESLVALDAMSVGALLAA